MSKTKHLRLIFDVAIDPNGVSVTELKANLERVAMNALDAGTVTGETMAIVEEYWKDGKITYPCTWGMKIRKDGHWQIV